MVTMTMGFLLKMNNNFNHVIKIIEMDSFIITPIVSNLESWGIYKNEIIGIDVEYNNLVLGKQTVKLPFDSSTPKTESYYPNYFKHKIIPKISFNDNFDVVCVWIETMDKVEWCFVKDYKIIYKNSILHKSTKSPPCNATGLYNAMFGIYGKGVWEFDKLVQEPFNFYLDGVLSDKTTVIYHDEHIIYKGGEVYYQSTGLQHYKYVGVYSDVIAFALNSGEVYIGTELLNASSKDVECFDSEYIILDKKLYNYKEKKYVDVYLATPDCKFYIKNNIMYRNFGNMICKIEKKTSTLLPPLDFTKNPYILLSSQVAMFSSSKLESILKVER